MTLVTSNASCFSKRILYFVYENATIEMALINADQVRLLTAVSTAR